MVRVILHVLLKIIQNHIFFHGNRAGRLGARVGARHATPVAIPVPIGVILVNLFHVQVCGCIHIPVCTDVSIRYGVGGHQIHEAIDDREVIIVGAIEVGYFKRVVDVLHFVRDAPSCGGAAKDFVDVVGDEVVNDFFRGSRRLVAATFQSIARITSRLGEGEAFPPRGDIQHFPRFAKMWSGGTHVAREDFGPVIGAVAEAHVNSVKRVKYIYEPSALVIIHLEHSEAHAVFRTGNFYG